MLLKESTYQIINWTYLRGGRWKCRSGKCGSKL